MLNRILLIRFFFISTAIFSLTLAHPQKQGNIWYFQGNGIDFNSGSPVLLTNGQIPSGNGIEGTATISDSAGNVLFYATAQNIWNSNHQPMLNGSGLMGGVSASQGVFIVPLPNSDSKFYVFTLDEFQNCFQNGLRYSIVNMCLDSGLGGIEYGYKNIPLLDTAGEKMAATFHSNGTDIWLVVHKYFSDAFYSYLITANGISDTVISHVGSYHPADSSTSCVQAIGQMKISPDGSKLALVNANAFTNSIKELFDFNNTTGTVSNMINLEPDSLFQYYGVSFSPDNSKLYLTKNPPYPYSVFQYDLTSAIPANIVASKTIIHTSNGPFAGLQLGPDGKIYVIGQGDNYISIIPNPNNQGIACGYIIQGVSNVNPIQYSFPNFIDSYGYKNQTIDCKSSGMNESSKTISSIYPNPFSSQTTFRTAVPLTNATLSVDNYFGQTVAQIINIRGQIITFSRDNLASGLYFVRLTEENKIMGVGKLVITDK